MATRRNSPIPATVAQVPRGILEILLQIATRSPHFHRAAGSSLEASHMDSTICPSVPPEAGGARRVRRLNLLAIAVVRATRSFGARAALDERRCSNTERAAARQAAAEPNPCRAAEPQPSRRRAAGEMQAIRR